MPQAEIMKGMQRQFLKNCRVTYVKRFPPRTAKAGTARRTVKKMGSWTLNSVRALCHALLQEQGPQREFSSMELHPYCKILWKTHPRMLARGSS